MKLYDNKLTFTAEDRTNIRLVSAGTAFLVMFMPMLMLVNIWTGLAFGVMASVIAYCAAGFANNMIEYSKHYRNGVRALEIAVRDLSPYAQSNRDVNDVINMMNNLHDKLLWDQDLFAISNEFMFEIVRFTNLIRGIKSCFADNNDFQSEDEAFVWMKGSLMECIQAFNEKDKKINNVNKMIKSLQRDRINPMFMTRTRSTKHNYMVNKSLIEQMDRTLNSMRNSAAYTRVEIRDMKESMYEKMDHICAIIEKHPEEKVDNHRTLYSMMDFAYLLALLEDADRDILDLYMDPVQEIFARLNAIELLNMDMSDKAVNHKKRKPQDADSENVIVSKQPTQNSLDSVYVNQDIYAERLNREYDKSISEFDSEDEEQYHAYNDSIDLNFNPDFTEEEDLSHDYDETESKERVH